MSRNHITAVLLVVCVLLSWQALNNARGQSTFGGGPTFPMAAAQINTNSAGAATWTYPAPCTASSLFWAQTQVAPGVASVNVWNVGAPSAGTQTFQVSLFTVASVLSINVLQVPASPGATVINVFCR